MINRSLTQATPCHKFYSQKKKKKKKKFILFHILKFLVQGRKTGNVILNLINHLTSLLLLLLFIIII